MAEPGNTLKPVGGKFTNYKSAEDQNPLMFSKVMHQAIPLEEAVLGAIMLDKDGFPSFIEILRSETFYLPAHQEIFTTMSHLFGKSQPIDLLTVHEALKKAGKLEEIGGVSY